MDSQDVLVNSFHELTEWKNEIEDIVFDILNESLKVDQKQSERIQIIMNELFDENNEVNGIIPNELFGKNLKNESTAQMYMSRVDIFDKKKDITKTLLHYTLGISYAPPDCELMSILYYLRSSIFYEVGMFKSALKDMERISLSNLSYNLKSSYHYQKAICHRALRNKLVKKILNVKCLDKLYPKEIAELDEKNKKLDISTDKGYDASIKPFVPELKNKNSKMPGLSDALELNYNEKFGRHIIATRDISPGELISVSKPYVTLSEFQERYHICSHCSKQTWTVVPCEYCPCALYCSDYCRMKSYEEYHDIECMIFVCLGNDMIDTTIALTLKIIIKAYKECLSNIDVLLSKYDDNSDVITIDEMYKNNNEKNTYLDILYLSKKYDPTDIIKNSKNFVESLILAYFFGIRIGLIKDELSLIELKKNDKFIKLIGFVEKTMRIVFHNKIYHFLQVPNKPEAVLLVNTTINPNTMHFAHQCDNNITRFYQDGYEIIYALNPIKKGEQVCDTYLHSFISKNLEERRAYVSNIFRYECNCKVCVDNWIVQEINLTDNISSDLKKLKQDITKLKNQTDVMYQLQNDYFCKNNKLYDASKQVEKLIKIVEECDRLLTPNYREYVDAKNALATALKLIRVPLIYPQ